jgi:hypothetical protein
MEVQAYFGVRDRKKRADTFILTSSQINPRTNSMEDISYDQEKLARSWVNNIQKELLIPSLDDKQMKEADVDEEASPTRKKDTISSENESFESEEV